MSLPVSLALIRNIEIAFAREAAAHAAAAAEINAFSEAEAKEMGDGYLVYCGQWSPVHGAVGLGLDGPVEEQDLEEVERFFLRKERHATFWLSPATDPSLKELLARDFHPTRKMSVHGLALTQELSLPPVEASSTPSHQDWALAFSKMLDPGAREPGLLALTKLHQKETRFYLGKKGEASYTFFHRGIALIPVSSSLLSLQWKEAKEFRAEIFASLTASQLPFLYERELYERI